MQSQIKQETFTVSEKYHQILLHENMKAAPVITFLSNSCKVSWTHDRKKFHIPLKARIDAIQKLQPPSEKKPKDFSEC